MNNQEKLDKLSTNALLWLENGRWNDEPKGYNNIRLQIGLGVCVRKLWADEETLVDFDDDDQLMWPTSITTRYKITSKGLDELNRRLSNDS